MTSQAPSEKNRVVILAGPQIWCDNTCATLISAGLNIVGICVCDESTAGLPLKYIQQSAKKRGVGRTIGQVLGRLVYRLVNGRSDREKLQQIFPEAQIRAALSSWKGPRHVTRSFGDQATISWISGLQPDVLVAHTGSWVTKKVRELPRKQVCIGGHPGLIPRYRGSHSAFWAIYHAHPEDVGCSVFWLAAGVDSGDLIVQERLPLEPGDSYFTLGWKGMKRIAELQAQVLTDFDRGIPIPRHPHASIPEGSEYHVPTLWEYVVYLWRQRRGPIVR
jgi:folate-dependent phosphoribosylglycinamide formyltransferase PurN